MQHNEPFPHRDRNPAGYRTLTAEAPIGILDSGLGGLAVVREVRRLLPNENILFLGDTARQPYGPRPIAEVQRFTFEIVGHLSLLGSKVVIIACNTASVAGGDVARNCFPELPIVDMITPGCKAALEVTAGRRMGVWGTEITVESRAYSRSILQLRPDIEVLEVACPELLRLAEKGQIADRDHLLSLARKYYHPLADFGVDTLILGCTDLTCVRDIVEEVVGPRVVVVDPAQAVAQEVVHILRDGGGFRQVSNEHTSCRFLITGEDLVPFSTFAARFLGVPHVHVEKTTVREAQHPN